MSKTKKVSLEAILQKKGLIDKVQPFFSDFFGGEIDIENTHAEAIMGFLTSENEGLYRYCQIIYTSCPVFRSKELLKEFEADDPYLVVKKAYGSNLAEIIDLGNHILSVYGYNEDKIAQLKKP